MADEVEKRVAELLVDDAQAMFNEAVEELQADTTIDSEEIRALIHGTAFVVAAHCIRQREALHLYEELIGVTLLVARE